MAFLVSDVMVTIPKTHPAGASVDEIRSLFEDDRVRLALIVDADGRLVTTIEREDLLAGDGPVAELGTLEGRTVGPSAPLASATRVLLRARKRRLAVVDDAGRLVGLLGLRRDALGFCSDESIRARAPRPRFRSAA